MDLELHAPTAAALIGAPTARLVVEGDDRRYADDMHFAAGAIDADYTRSVEFIAGTIHVSEWVANEVVNVETFDRAAFIAALAADRIGILP